MNILKEGLVIKAVSGTFYVDYLDKVLECKSSTKLKRNKDKILPGDIVLFDEENNYIKGIKERTNELIRPKLANVSNAILVFSLANPKMNFGLLDRMLMIMEFNNLISIILLTKVDLITKEEEKELMNKLIYYKQKGYEILLNNEIDDSKSLKEFLQEGQKYVLTGQSGVGKSTFLNKIYPNLNLQTQEISKALGRGKHTTRETTFYKLDNLYLIDTPGFSALDLELTKEQIRDNFKDFWEISTYCKFNGCYHLKEPGCEVKKEVESGKILKSRYENYVKLMEGK